MTTKYLKNLSEDDILQMIRYVTPEAKDLSVESKDVNRFYVTVKAPIVAESGMEFADDFYSITDYNIEPYDWSGDIYDENIEYRKAMHKRFGNEYALDFLFGTYIPE